MHTVNHDIPAGPGLFAVTRTGADGNQPGPFITNIRRLAGRERRPGSVLITAATWLLAALDAGLLYVSFDAQYTYIFAVKHASVPAMIEAAMLDAGMVILSALGIGLALAGKPSKGERTLIMACSAASAGMNFAAANPGSWRSVVAYTAAPVFLAIITDRVISVIRRHVLPLDAESAWAPFGRAVLACARLSALVTLYLLRTALAPSSTLRGLRQMVLDAAPVPGMAVVAPVPAIEPPCGDEHQDEQPDDPSRQDQHERWPDQLDEQGQTFKTKKDHFLHCYRQHPDYGNRARVSQVAALIAPLCDLKPGTGRTYAYEECARLEAAARSKAGGTP